MFGHGLRTIISFLCGLLIACLSLKGENPDIAFRRLSTPQGLSQSSVYTIAQDSKGYLWIGTGDGLNRYDSYDFTVYRNEKDNPRSIAGNRITATFIDDSGNLLIGSTKGLSLYNPQTDDFSNFQYRNSHIQINAIGQTADSSLLLTTENGLLVFNTETEEFRMHGTVQDLSCLCLHRDGMLVGSKDGLYLYSSTGESMTRVIPELEGTEISQIIYIPRQGCWIATLGKGIYSTDDNLNITGHFFRENCGLTSNDIRALCIDYSSRLWIGSIDGLFIYDRQSGRFDRYSYSPDDITSIGHNSVRTIFMDNQNGMWTGTYYGGLNYYHPLASRFSCLSHHHTHNSLNDNKVACITEDKGTGNLWIGTNDGGLNRYDPKGKSFMNYQDIGLKSDNIKCIHQDRSGRLYIGTHGGGLASLAPGSRHVENYTISTTSRLDNSCYAIEEIDDRTLLVGALNGLYTFDKRTKTFRMPPETEKRLKGINVYDLLKDSKGKIWICSNRGLFQYDTSTEKLTAFEKMTANSGMEFSNAQLVTAMEDSRGNIWIGGDHGLLKFDDGSGNFTCYRTQDGLPNNFIDGIAEDGTGRLWISTNNGISCFDPIEGTFRNYSHITGADNIQFLPNSFCRSSDGLIYFGSISGLIWFDPMDMPENRYSPAPVISDITVFNRKALPEDNLVYTKNGSGDNIGVSFPSRNHIFSIRYTVVNPTAFSDNRFAYTLKNFDTQWYETGNREVSYSNLPPGKYTFMLRSCNNDGIWSGETLSFPIHITPMWYQTLAFRIFIALSVILLIMLAIREYISHADKKRKEAATQEKIRFYINLSHEIRTPLTLIMSPLEDIRKHGVNDRYVESRIGIVQHNTSKLLYMVNQMLDYRKAETGMMKLRITETDINGTVADICSMFDTIASDRNIEYTIKSSLKQERYPADRLFVERILSNLLSNAFKFTPDGGMVRVSVAEDGKNMIIKVKDNGKGLSEEDRKKIFERFYKADESSFGSGIGLSFVKALVDIHHGTIGVTGAYGEGCEFTVCLPVTENSYSKDEICGQETASQTAVPIPEMSSNASMVDPALSDSNEEGDRKNILIVEDNAEIRQYLAESFTEHYSVRTAANGEEALGLIREKNPDIIITDIMMPVMDGSRLLKNLKTNINTSHIPVIVLSAKGSTDDQLVGITAGADDYLPKPFSISILKAKVANLLKTRDRIISHYAKSTDIEPERLTQNPVDAEFLKKVIDIIEQNMDNPALSVEDFCSALYISKSTLHMKMKSITGESILAFVRKMRLQKACGLLLKNRHTITEISEMTGFSSASYFATIFRKEIGCLPSDYGKAKV